jgi:arginase family enzyme
MLDDTEKVKLIVKEAVREMFLHLDLDVNDPDAVSAFRKNQQHLHTWRLRMELLATKAFVTLMLTLVPATLAFVWLTLTQPRG